MPWPRPPNPFLLDAPRTSSNRLEYPSRLGFTPAPPAPAPGSLSNLLGVSSQSADNGGDSEEEDGEDQGQPIDPLAEDQNQDQTEHLHPDYQHSILGDGFGRHDDPLHYMINNTIAGLQKFVPVDLCLVRISICFILFFSHPYNASSCKVNPSSKVEGALVVAEFSAARKMTSYTTCK